MGTDSSKLDNYFLVSKDKNKDIKRRNCIRRRATKYLNTFLKCINKKQRKNIYSYTNNMYLHHDTAYEVRALLAKKLYYRGYEIEIRFCAKFLYFIKYKITITWVQKDLPDIESPLFNRN